MSKSKRGTGAQFTKQPRYYQEGSGRAKGDVSYTLARKAAGKPRETVGVRGSRSSTGVGILATAWAALVRFIGQKRRTNVKRQAKG